MTDADPPPLELLAEVLDRLEDQEANLLTWGLVDGAFTDEEIYTTIDALLASPRWRAADVDADGVLEALLDRALLTETYSGGERSYRTRMAEAIRLLARLRQLFPQQMDGQRWRTAPRLVADFRLAIRPREFPARTTPVNKAQAEIAQSARLEPPTRQLLANLLRVQGPDDYRLARFQIDAASHILSSLRTRRTKATIVTAGTGSGKTLAFYLPGLVHVGAQLEKAAHVTRAVAIYPRNELLADQMTETLAQTRRVQPSLEALGRRKLVVGAFFGPSPTTNRWLSDAWKAVPDGHVCPYVRCPDCGQAMVWLASDRAAGVERLVCTSDTCALTVGPDEIVLTRHSMATRPPDVLFTSTEMLNRQLSDSRHRHVFGIGSVSVAGPLLVLLDEVHTYEGLHGAHVALLLRRWRHACRSPMHFVGLSATLRQAGRFFGDLVGLDEADVEEIAPAREEMIASGREYLIALRGDPVSGTSLLSTTIQTSMLTRRVLDPWRPSADGLYGQSAFVFTDNLDVTNRLFNQLQDAEGLDSFGRPNPARPEGSLANLRASTQPDLAERRPDGQAWSLCEEIGHPLIPTTHLQIDRTSSQDAGVLAGSDLVVATASLEVGFNDPSVGAVIQHKAPHDAARFLQRKGRAGRQRKMRPWTIVVLSDYGRDRLAYQGYDLLFDPELTARSLPVHNRSVRRMQAVYTVMDWLAGQLVGSRGSVYDDLAGPARSGQGGEEPARRQRRLAELIEAVLTDPERRGSLTAHFVAALQLSEDEVTDLYWESPRGLLTEALPTALRRLRTEWRRIPDGTEFDGIRQPLPEFVPPTLFSDLSLPEVTLDIPDARDEAEPPRLGVRQALSEYACGRVSRRYGTRHRFQSHWVPPPAIMRGEQSLALGSFVTEHRELGDFTPIAGGPPVRCVRPYRISLASKPRDIRDTSNSRLRWETEIVTPLSGLELDTPQLAGWGALAPSITFYLHGRREELQIRRFSVGAEARILDQIGNEFETTIRYVDGPDGAPVAVGFALDVDGIKVAVQPPQDIIAGLPEKAIRAARTAYFRAVVDESPVLASSANHFQRMWLADIFLAAVAETACGNGSTLAEAVDRLTGTDGPSILATVLDTIFQSLDAVGDEDQEIDGPEQARLHLRLGSLIASADVRAALGRHAEVLWTAPSRDMHRWLVRRWTVTLGAAIRTALERLCADLDASDLLLDIAMLGRERVEFFITETTIGGGGFIEEAHRRSSSDARRFFHLIESALGPTDLELVDPALRTVVDLLETDDHVANLARQVRAPAGVEGLRRDFDVMLVTLAGHGVRLSHAVTAALSARLFRPGATAQLDTLLSEVLDRWDHEEARLGIEFDPRVVAYLYRGDTRVEAAIGGSSPGGGAVKLWRMNLLAGLLWPRGAALRERALETYSPFIDEPPPDRLLVDAHFPSAGAAIPLSDPAWHSRLQEMLVESGTAGLAAAPSDYARLAIAISTTLVQAVEYGHLLLYPRVAGLRTGDKSVIVVFELREALQ